MPRLGVEAPAAAFGGATAEALGTLGRTLEGAGDKLFTRAMALQQLENEAAARDAATDYMIQAGKLHADYNALQGKAAVAAYPKYTEDLRKLREDIKGSLLNPSAQKMYDSASMPTMGRTIFNGAGHAASENRQYQIGSSQARIAAAGDAAAQNPTDDRGFAASVADVQTQVHNLGNIDGWSPEQIKQKQFEAVSDVWTKRVVGFARTQPFTARELLNANRASFTAADLLRADQAVTTQTRAVGSVNIAKEIYAGGQGTDDTPPKTLAQMEKEAEARAKKLFPDDPVLQQNAVSALQRLYNQDKYAKKQEQLTNEQTVLEGIEAGAKNEQELLANPRVAAAFEALPPAKRLAVPGQINRFQDSKNRDTNRDTDNRLYGLSNNDVEAYLNTDITAQPLGHEAMRKHLERQRKLKERASGDPRVSRAVGQMRGAFGPQMEALGIYSRTEKTKDDFDKFTGALQTALDVWQEENKRPATYKDIIDTIGPQIIRNITEPGWLWGTNQVPFFKQSVPAKFSETVKADMVARGLPEPSAEQIQRAYVRMEYMRLFGKKEAAPK